MRKSSLLMTVGLLCLLVGSAAQDPALASSRAIASTFFGITVNALNSGSSWPVPVQFGTAGKAASGSYWFNLEPSNGTFDWTPLDNIVDSARAAGVTNIMYTFFETPQWASSNATQSCSATAKQGVYGCAAPPKNINDWDAFVTAVVTRYKGEIQYYEPWNEPDVPSEYSGSIPEMVLLAQRAYTIIKSIDPSATVLTPSVSVGGDLSSNPDCGSSMCWLAAYLAAGGGKYADAVDFHGKACDASTSICVSNDIACPGNELQECAGTPLVNQIDDVRAIMANNGLSALPLINTEGGYADTTVTNDLSSATADQQAAYVSRFYIIQASEDLSIAVYFSWLQNIKGYNFTGFGTTAAEPEINRDYQQTYDWLLGSTMGGPCSENSGSVWTCPTSLGTGQAGLIVWSDSATSYAPTTGSYTSYQDLNGTTFSIGSTIPIGILPELLESEGGVSSSSTTASASTTASTIASSSSTATISTTGTQTRSSTTSQTTSSSSPTPSTAATSTTATSSSGSSSAVTSLSSSRSASVITSAPAQQASSASTAESTIATASTPTPARQWSQAEIYLGIGLLAIVLVFAIGFVLRRHRVALAGGPPQ